jgi:hypothetical protein
MESTPATNQFGFHFGASWFLFFLKIQQGAVFQAGVDVMIAIFCHFCQYSAKKCRFSKKAML